MKKNNPPAPAVPDSGAEPEKLPVRVKPMEPVSAREPFSDSHFVFQIKWDGVRILAFVTPEGVRLQNRRGRERTLQYPEFQVLREIAGAKGTIFDGEAVVLENGLPSFSRIIERDFSVREDRIKRLSRIYPCTFCIFDILYLQGEDITHLPLHRRQDVLQQLLGDFQHDTIYLNSNFTDGKLLYRQICARELEGIVAKDKNSPYLTGVKSSHWLKIKPRRNQLAVAGGIAYKNGAVSSLLLGAYHDGKLYYTGRAGSGLSSDDYRLLKDTAARLASPRPFFTNPPRIKEVAWLKPVLTVETEFMEWTDGLMMRAPVIKGFSPLPPEKAVF